MKNLTENHEFQGRKISLEKIFSSKGKVKILELLAIEGELNITEIVKQTSMNHSSVIQNLEELKNFDFVQEKRFHKIRIYRYKIENFNARALKNLIDLWRND